MRRNGILTGLLCGCLALFHFVPTHHEAAAQGRRAGVYTFHGDNRRLGWYGGETRLSEATVAGAFGKLWSRPVDGQVYAQPLYVPDLDVGGERHNVVFVATEHNSVYAFDADTGGEAPLWQTWLGPSVPVNEIREGGAVCRGVKGPEYGITGTPVIDPSTGTMYVVALTSVQSRPGYVLYALDIRDGTLRPGWPVGIEGVVAGEGGGSWGGWICFDPLLQLQRAGLVLQDGLVIVAFGSHCNFAPVRYHGWLFSYDVARPDRPPAIFNATPDPSTEDPLLGEAAGGIWQAGWGPAAAEMGALFVATDNGVFDVDLGRRNIGNSIVRIETRGGDLQFFRGPESFFTPSNQRDLDDQDMDVGSAGIMLLPDQEGTTTPRLLVAGGKDGVIRLLNREDLGGYTGRDDDQTPDHSVQSLPNPLTGWRGTDPRQGGVFGGPAYWEGPGGTYLFFTGNRLPLRRYRLGVAEDGRSQLVPDGEGGEIFEKYPAPTPVVSSDGRSPGSGLVWVLRRDDDTLSVFSAETLQLLWSSGWAPADALDGGVVKFSVPIVANGKVYVATKDPAELPDEEGGIQGFISCYGLLDRAAAVSAGSRRSVRGRNASGPK